MNNERSEILKHLTTQTGLMAQMLQSLRRIEAGSAAPEAPNYRRRLAEFSGFDWDSIDATVVARDEKGVDEVEWAGHRFDRAMGRAFDENFIIFSRPAPGWTQQNKIYFTLIKFADYNKSPLVAPAPALIRPMDVQRTAPAQSRPEPPPKAARVASIAARVEGDPRLTFYEIGGKAMGDGKIAVQKFNSIVTKASREGWTAALTELQLVLG